MSQRAQTTLDFALGVSIFIGILFFVFMFVPGILAPFEGGVQEETVATNRVADGLVDGGLGSPDAPSILDQDCTVWFFEHAGGAVESSPSDCRFDGGNLTERVGVGPRQRVNVTVVGNVSVAGDGNDPLCWDASADQLGELGTAACGDPDDVALRAGDDAPDRNDATVTAVRVAWLAGEDVTIAVEMW